MPFAVFYNAKGSLLHGKNECHLLVSKTNYALSYSIFCESICHLSDYVIMR